MKYPRLLSVALLSGTIIGAGMFSLPFVVRTVGFGAGLGYLAFFAGIYIIVHRMYASLLLTRADGGDFIRVARAYLPHRMSRFAGGAILSELLLVLVIYLILAPSFLELVVPGTGVVGGVLFWALGSAALFLRTSWLGWGEVFGVAAILGIVGIIGIVAATGGAGPLSFTPAPPLSLGGVFLPFGPLLFSLAGRPAIGKVVEVFRAARSSGRPFALGSVLGWGTALPAVVYAVFIVGVLRLAPDVGPDAVLSISPVVHGWLVGALGILGLVILWTSYAVVGVNVKDLLERDLGWGRVLAAIVATLSPLIIYAAGVRDFIGAVGFAGGVFLAAEGLAIVAMWRRAFPRHPLRPYALLLVPVFLAALAYEAARLAGVIQ